MCTELQGFLLYSCSARTIGNISNEGKVVPLPIQLSTTPWRLMEEWIYGSTCSWSRQYWSWVVSFTPRGKSPDNHCIGDWVGPIAGPDDVEKRKFLAIPGLNSYPSAFHSRSQSVYRLRWPAPENASNKIRKAFLQCNSDLSVYRTRKCFHCFNGLN
jgi:hypothetical protein